MNVYNRVNQARQTGAVILKLWTTGDRQYLPWDTAIAHIGALALDVPDRAAIATMLRNGHAFRSRFATYSLAPMGATP
jgi:hypothetical protein